MQRFILNTILVRAVSTVLNFMVALLIARHAGPAVKGEVTLLVTTIWFFIFFSNILGGQVLVYLVPRNKTELLVIPAYIWCFIIAGFGFLLLKSTVLVQANHVTSVTILSLLSSIISIHQTVLLGRKQITNSNLLQLIPVFMQVAGVLFCFYFLHISDAYAYIYASGAAYGITLLASFLFVRNYISFRSFTTHFNLGALRESFRYGILFQIVEILQLFSLRYYFYQLGLQQGSQYLGVYSIGISILEAVWIIPRSMATVHYVSTSNSTEMQKEIDRTILLSKVSFVLCAAALLIIGLVPSQVYTYVFGAGFQDVKHSMRFLYPGILIYSVPVVISSFYLGTGNYKPLIVSHLTGAITIVCFSLQLIPSFVMSGAGLAATIAFSFTSLTLSLYFVMDHQIPLKKFGISRTEMLNIAKETIATLSSMSGKD